MQKNIEEALVGGIRKTINRFRERPLNYFTESDIHSSLMKDIMEGNSDIFLQPYKNSDKGISLLHNEYPTNFLYKYSWLTNLNKIDYNTAPKEVNIERVLQEIELTQISNTFEKGRNRGHYDLSVLNNEFVTKQINNDKISLTERLKHIINKDIKKIKGRSGDKYYKKELSYAIEVKYLQPFNSTNKGMFIEVVKDNTKLALTKIHSNEFTKTINLIFCSSEYNKDNSVVSDIKNYIKGSRINGYKTPEGVINIFIESYLSGEIKNTPKPIVYLSGKGNSFGLYEDFKKALKID